MGRVVAKKPHHRRRIAPQDRDPEKGAVYQVDMNKERNDAFEAFAWNKGIPPRDAARALLLWAAGILPKEFWRDENDRRGGGYSKGDRRALLAVYFPHGRKQTSVRPRSEWFNASTKPEMRGTGQTLEQIDLAAAVEWDKTVVERESRRRRIYLAKEKEAAERCGVDWWDWKQMTELMRKEKRAEYRQQTSSARKKARRIQRAERAHYLATRPWGVDR